MDHEYSSETTAPPKTFTLGGWLAILLIVGLLLALLTPAIQAAREATHRNQCTDRMKAIGLALQSHHDVFKRFPALTNQGERDGSANVWDTAPGATFVSDTPPPNGYQQSPTSAAGYSWLVRLLPYLNQLDLYNGVSAASKEFRYEAFSTTGFAGKPFAPAKHPKQHFATIQLDELQCPSFAGNAISTASSGTAQPPVTIAAYATHFSPSGRSATGVAITNYFALSATHLACMALGVNEDKTDDAEPPNGVIVPGQGLNMKSVLDGTSKTLIVSETKEPAVNSWYDGTVCWTVGANPSASSQPIRQSGFWSIPSGTTAAGSLNYGPGKNGTPLFAPDGTTPAQTQPVSWGPSSDHAGGVVQHLACDGSAHALTSDIDPTLYFQLITRAGGEPVLMCGPD